MSDKQRKFPYHEWKVNKNENEQLKLAFLITKYYKKNREFTKKILNYE